MSDYKRVLLNGCLRAESNLHIGSGDVTAIAERNTLCNELVLDATCLPFIPASSLRGFLSSRIEASEMRKKLFGLGRQNKDSDDPGNCGRVRIRDALLKRNRPASRILVSRTSIDPLTAAAKTHHLATHRLIEPGSEFLVRIELDEVDARDLECLLAVLSGFGTASDWRLGKGKNIGQGKLSWQAGEIRVLREERLKQWLKTPRAPDSKSKKNSPKYKKAASTGTTESNKADFFALFETVDFRPDAQLSKWESLEIEIAVDSPLLINDPRRVEAREKLFEDLTKELERDNPPDSNGELGQRIERLAHILAGIDDPNCASEIRRDLAVYRSRCDKTDRIDLLFKEIVARFGNADIPDAIYMRQRRQACLPGSTLKGWVRAQCRRILLTLKDAKDGDAVDAILEDLFGGTNRDPGCLRFDDALAPVDENTQLHAQTFNAIDRFTGGVKAGALFNVEAVWPVLFTGSVHFRPGRLKPWMKMLLLYMLRDAEQGDLVLGWGKSKGYGRLRLKPVFENPVIFDEHRITRWHDSLLRQLNPPKDAS